MVGPCVATFIALHMYSTRPCGKGCLVGWHVSCGVLWCPSLYSFHYEVFIVSVGPRDQSPRCCRNSFYHFYFFLLVKTARILRCFLAVEKSFILKGSRC